MLCLTKIKHIGILVKGKIKMCSETIIFLYTGEMLTKTNQQYVFILQTLNYPFKILDVLLV